MPTLDVISTVASTVMSTIVAAVALLFSYRQNLGWRPVALVTGSSLSGRGGKRKFRLQVSLELWNRRKYPIVVRALHAEITGVEILDIDPTLGDMTTYVRRNMVDQRLEEETILPSSAGKFAIEVDIENQSLDAIKPFFEITMRYFDPYKNKLSSLTLSHQFFYPELGWRKSDEQRSHIAKVYDQPLCAEEDVDTREK